MKKVIVIGAGFSGLSAATELASKGYQVQILEKNDHAGGRARVFQSDGFTFDMGPSWYWMPDIFENYFGRYGKKPSDYYELIRLDPSYSVILSDTEKIDLPANYQDLKKLFESYEAGAGASLDAFMEQAAYKYKVGIQEFVWKPSRKITEFLSLKLLVDAIRIDVFSSFYTHIRKFFTSPTLLKLMEFTIFRGNFTKYARDVFVDELCGNQIRYLVSNGRDAPYRQRNGGARRGKRSKNSV